MDAEDDERDVSDDVVVSVTSGDGDVVGRTLSQQNAELRRRLNDEHAQYRRKLQSYHDEQQRQAVNVQKLQAKVTSDTSSHWFCSSCSSGSSSKPNTLITYLFSRNGLATLYLGHSK